MSTDRIPSGMLNHAFLQDAGLVDESCVVKYEPAYRLISEHIPGFSWDINHFTDGRSPVVKFTSHPKINGLFPSLADLVRHARGDIVLQFDSLPKKVERVFRPVISLGKVGHDFVRLFTDMGVSLPVSPDFTLPIARWLDCVSRGVPSSIFFCVCPDYAHKDGKYTFESLGNDVGLVARRAQKIIPQLHAFFAQRDIHMSFVVAIADFEARNDATCKKVGLTEEAFYDKLRESQHCLRDGIPNDITVETPFATELGPWDAHMTEGKQRVAAGDISGAFNASSDVLEYIVTSRTPLVKRWHGDSVDVRASVLSQAVDYFAVARLTDTLNNALIIGTESPVMSVFYQIGTTTVYEARPVLYLKKENY